MTRSRPKICILTETYSPVMGGGERQAQSLAERLVKRGYSVVVMTRKTDATHPRHEVLCGVMVFRCRPTGASRRKKWGLVVTSFWELIRRKSDYDVILVSGFRTVGIAAVIAARLLRKVCLLKADSLGEMSGAFFRAGLAPLGLRPESAVVRLLLRLRNRQLRKVNAFVSISTAVKEELIDERVEPSRIQFIPNSVDTARFEPVDEARKRELRNELHLNPETLIVTYTGRLVSYKGLPNLLSTWARFVRSRANAQLLLVGEGGLDMHNCENELREFVRANQLSDNVRFCGRVQDVERYLQASDIFVFPTQKEAFGISLIEAMACGLPAVTTRTGGVVDIIEQDMTGLFVDGEEPEQLLGALNRLASDPTLRRSIGGAARQHVVDRFSESSVTAKYEALFSEMLRPEIEVST